MSDNQKSSHGTRLVIAITVAAGLASIATLLFGDNLVGRLQGSSSDRSPIHSNGADRTSTAGDNGLTFGGEVKSAPNSADAMASDLAYNTAWDTSANANVTTENGRLRFPPYPEAKK